MPDWNPAWLGFIGTLFTGIGIAARYIWEQLKERRQARNIYEEHIQRWLLDDRKALEGEVRGLWQEERQRLRAENERLWRENAALEDENLVLKDRLHQWESRRSKSQVHLPELPSGGGDSSPRER